MEQEFKIRAAEQCKIAFTEGEDKWKMKRFLVHKTVFKIQRVKEVFPKVSSLFNALKKESNCIYKQEQVFRNSAKWGSVSTKLEEMRKYSIKKEKQLEQLDQFLQQTFQLIKIIDEVASGKVYNDIKEVEEFSGRIEEILK